MRSQMSKGRLNMLLKSNCSQSTEITRYLTLLLILTFLSFTTGCSFYVEKKECIGQTNLCSTNRETNWPITVFINGIFFLGIIGAIAEQISKINQSEQKGQSPESEPICAAINELLKLTGGYNEGTKFIFQEVRPQDKHRIKELCEFLLKEEEFIEEAKALDELAVHLEENKADISDISKLREVAQERRILGQAVSELLKRATD